MLHQSAHVKQKNEHAKMHKDINSFGNIDHSRLLPGNVGSNVHTPYTHNVQLQQTLNKKLKVMAHHIVSELGPNFILNGC